MDTMDIVEYVFGIMGAICVGLGVLNIQPIVQHTAVKGNYFASGFAISLGFAIILRAIVG